MTLSREIAAVVERHLGRTFPSAVLVIRQGGEEVYASAFGWLDPETRLEPARLDSLFDLASVSKLFTVTAFMSYLEQGSVRLDQPVRELLPEFDGERAIGPYPDPVVPGAFVSVTPGSGLIADASRVTFRHLLAHNSGLPAWQPLYREGNRERAYAMALRSTFAYPTGTHVVYSDIGLVLLGLALERLTGSRLDEIVRERVSAPLGLDSIGYNPAERLNIAPTELCAWRKRRLAGEVHDENAGGMDGIAGHAGLFGHARDLAEFGEMFLRSGAPLLRPETVQAMTRLQAQKDAVRRGLGFALWSPDPKASSNPLSPDTYGHSGFTGTSLWLDPQREIVIACLTNRVYYGRSNAEAIGSFRVMLNQVIASNCVVRRQQRAP